MRARHASSDEALTSVWYGRATGRRATGRRTVRAGAPPQGRPPLAPGTLLAGRYQLEEVVGTGALATVYSARDRLLHRTVAVKVYPAGTAAAIPRDETRLQASCQHPHLMPLHDAGSDSLAGVSFLVMPLYPGDDLAGTLAVHGPLPFRTALLCAEQVCSALEFLHNQRSTLHGDVKTANVYLTRSGSALLFDFNLRALQVRRGGTAAGTPGYTAPEALLGRADARSDLFSLGCVLYESLAGRPPFADDAAVLRGRFTPLSRLRPGIRPELELLVHRMLAADPARRYQSARELRAALRSPRYAREAGWTVTGLLALKQAARVGRWGLGGLAVGAGAWLRAARRRPKPVLAGTAAALFAGYALLQGLVEWTRLHPDLVLAFAAGALVTVGAGLRIARQWRAYETAQARKVRE